MMSLVSDERKTKRQEKEKEIVVMFQADRKGFNWGGEGEARVQAWRTKL
jgi:hypothetical protein